MRVTIVGAGVVGVATAYFVAQRGHAVTVLERRAMPAQDASFANAGQLSYSYTDTLADPGLLRRLPSMLLGRDIGMRISLDPALLPWGWRFLWQCTRERADRNTVQLLHLAADSARALDELLENASIEFDHRPAGKLMLTASEKTLSGLRRRAALKRQHGARVEILGAAECRSIEPALEGWRSEIAGAAYAENDHAGDARAFTRGLADYLIAKGMVRMMAGVEVRGLVRRGDRVTGVRTQEGVLESDAVIVCTGVGTRQLLRRTGLSVPIYPLKGYSVTPQLGPHPPQVSLTDLDRRIVFANLGGRIRLAGLADCVGLDASVDPQRVADLVQLGRSVMPEAARFDSPLDAWAGLRPATPSGLPIVGRTRLRGLHLNVGHGALGWTLACGTARALAAQLEQNP
jgi:D-amino-acid dehydrogenase